MAGRIHNFNPGPAALPLAVLEEARDEFLDFKGSGMSVTEISHRSALFEEVLNDAVARVTRLLKLPDNFKVLFLQGGASTPVFHGPHEPDTGWGLCRLHQHGFMVREGD